MQIRINKDIPLFTVFIAFFWALTASGLFSSIPLVNALFFLVSTTLLLILVSSKKLRTPSEMLVFWVSYLMKVGYALYRIIFAFGGNLTDPNLSLDAKRFWEQASSLLSGETVSPETRFPYLLKIEFLIFGKNLFCVFLLNICLTMLMMLLVSALLDKINTPSYYRFVPLLIVGFLPYEIIVSCSLLRESVYFVFITLSFYFYCCYIGSKKYKDLLFAVLAVVPVALLHTGYIIIACVYIVDSFICDKPRNFNDVAKRMLLFFSVVIVCVWAITMDSDGAGYFSRGLSTLTSSVSGGRDSFSEEAGSRYLEGMTITSFPTLLAYAPIRWFYFLFSPLPTNWRGMTDIIAFLLDSCVHGMIILCALVAKRTLRKNIINYKSNDVYRGLSVGLLCIVFLALVFCLNTGTAGTAIRHRDVLIGIETALLGFSLRIRGLVKYED